MGNSFWKSPRRQVCSSKKRLKKIFCTFNREAILFIDEEKFENLIVGLLDKEGFCIGLGILKKISFEKGFLVIETPLKNLKSVAEVRFGRIKFDDTKEFFIPKESL